MLKHTFGLILILFLVISIPRLDGQGIDHDSFVFNRWGMEDGLPQSSVNDIIQTRDGYIWMATFGGLVRFDGVQFTTFDRSNTPGMYSDRILELFEAPDSSIWMSTEKGFLRLKSGIIESFLFEVNSQYISPQIIVMDSIGTLWIVVSNQIWRFNGVEFERIIPIRQESFSAGALADSSGVWLVSDNEIIKTSGEDAVVIADLSVFTDSEIVGILEYPAGSGTIFLATSRGGILKYNNGTVRQYTQQDGLPSLWTRSLMTDNAGNLWATSFGGVSFWNGSGFTRFEALSNTTTSLVTSILHDLEGNYWAGTSGDGFYRFRNSIITTIDQNQGLANESMLSLTTLSDGTALFATNCGGVFHWNGEAASHPPVNDYLPNLCIWSVFQDSEGWIWMGSRGLYKTMSLDTPGIFYDSSNGFDCSEVFAITEDSSGTIWIGCLDGLVAYRDNTFKKYTSEDGLSYNDVRTIFEAADGTLWIGTSIGLNSIKNGIISNIPLTDTDGITEPYVRAIHQDSEGVLWIGTYGNGIFRIKNGKVHQITRASGLFDNVVSHLVEDDAGNFWLGSNRGISRVRKDDLNAYFAGALMQVQTYSYSNSDGLKSAETNGGFQPNVISDDRGYLYFPTVAGVAVVSTRDVQYNEIPPTVNIESLYSGVVEVPMQDKIILSYDNAFLQINYTALSFRDPAKILFRYRLEGLDDTWVDVGTARTALYTKIPPGQYTFRVIASNNDGVWNMEGASLPIEVIPPFWAKTWFRVLVMFSLYGIVIGFFYLREQRLKQISETKKRFSQQLIESQELERKRIAGELHDGLGQQILVIKNRVELARIQIDNRDALKSQLDEIAGSATDSIAEVRHIAHGLRPVHLEKFGITEALNTLCDELQQTSGVEWSYHIANIDGLIPSGQEINLYRVVQEATNNILRHSAASNASVMISRKQKSIEAVIWDDGKGINFEYVESKKGTLTGFGLQGMHERIESLGGVLKVETAEEDGTVIKFEIPIMV